jgi:hypothetical protein
LKEAFLKIATAASIKGVRYAVVTYGGAQLSEPSPSHLFSPATTSGRA